MDRVWNSRGRAGLGFGQSGAGLGRVLANFESRVRVLHCQVSGLGRVSNLCQKGVNSCKMLKILKIFLPFRTTLELMILFLAIFYKIFQ